VVVRNGRKWLVTILVGGLLVGMCFAALIPGIVTLATAQHYTSTEALTLGQLSEPSTVYDAKGNVIGYIGLEKREPVNSLAEVPKILQNAVIATEDSTFWTNDGFDLAGTARAAIKNATSGRIEQGGSTITQQLVKKRLLSSKQTVNRKVKELILAVRLTHQYSKREILTQYLNTVYFGPAASPGQGAYGVKAAVGRFFLVADPGPYYRAERLDEITLGQAALLAGIIRSPADYDPFAHPDAAKQRRSFVLQRMLDQGYITPQQRVAANAEPLPTINDASVLQPHDIWTDEVQKRLLNDPRLGATPQAREAKVLRGGLQIYTTKDPDLQAKADDAVYGPGGLPNKPGFSGALVAIDPRTGAVKAMAVPPYAQLQYNIATAEFPGRQTGSTWKVITEAAAFDSDKQFSPNDFVSGASPCAFGKLGETRNAEGSGSGTIRQMTEESVNCAFARIELAVGFDKVIDTAYKVGIDPARRGTAYELKPYLTLTLGTIGASPLEMATVAATIADSGVHHDPYFVQRVTDSSGRLVFDEAPTNFGTQAISPDAANCEMDVLRGVIKHGTGHPNAELADPNRIAFGKTGTTDRKADAWFLGGTPGQLVAAVWHGALSGTIPGAGFGGQIPAKIWSRFMNAALADQPIAVFPPAGPVCDRPGGRLGPDVTGQWTRFAPDATTGPGGPFVPTFRPSVRQNPPPTSAPSVDTTPTTVAVPPTPGNGPPGHRH